MSKKILFLIVGIILTVSFTVVGYKELLDVNLDTLSKLYISYLILLFIISTTLYTAIKGIYCLVGFDDKEDIEKENHFFVDSENQENERIF